MSLDALFDPRSVAVVGASANPAKWGYWLAAGALAGRSRRSVHLVNQRGGHLDGVPFLPDLGSLATVPEQIVVAVPPQQVRPVVVEGLAAGARCFTVITSGGSGPEEERELASLVTSHGGRLLGPNCMGVVDTTTELRLSWGDFPAGAVGLVSQSGNLALEIGRLLARAGQGFSRFVSLGNQRDIDAADALDALIAHDATRVVAAYVEDFRDGRRLARTLAAAHAAGKPVLLLTLGRSEASGRAAASHTGALVSARAVVDAVCRDTGAILLESAGELVDTAVLLTAARHGQGQRRAQGRIQGQGQGSCLGRGRAVPEAAADADADAFASDETPASPEAPRIAVVGDSGGQGALAADALTARGLHVPVLDEATRAAVAAHLPGRGGCGNPVDLAGAGEADLRNYARITRALLDGGDTDATVLTGYFGDYATANPEQTREECEVAEELGEAARKAGRLLVVHTMARDTPALTVLREHGVPVYERIEQAATALAHAARLERATPYAPPGRVPPPSRPVADGGYESVRALLRSHGLDFPTAEFVTTADEAADAARRTGYPLALKAMGLAHKTEAGGVALGIVDETALRAAFARMRDTTGAARYAVEEMAVHPHSVELIAGVRYDPAFGPVAMVGLGGVTAELLADTALALAPLTPVRARELLLSLRHAPLLTGWRGAPAVDLDAAADALCALARAASEHPELIELEVNPLLVHPGGAVALDAHGVLT
ncbi:acetate--CoA ligase family protein [Streptomyces vietnamensis]|uniref:CoA-binding protein n=1 Tax=Streptomyces vietnamensis TaxID=362257 RepID=A0A0B5HTT4_9ACTN|nr:acetate--CoA ligase family protein [Streptomyces vietnamensis]AJF63896.1 CoA-binding protein [Streptomyces vietnamensis]